MVFIQKGEEWLILTTRRGAMRVTILDDITTDIETHVKVRITKPNTFFLNLVQKGLLEQMELDIVGREIYIYIPTTKFIRRIEYETGIDT